MRNHKVEILGKPNSRTIDCFVCSPAFGAAGELMPHALQRVILNDGKNRVLVGVYNHPLDIDLIKLIVRQAIDRNPHDRF